MKISFVVAASENGVIGVDNSLPWHLPDDFKFFKQTTMGKPIIMGRKTFESFNKALPGRLNLILSRRLTQPPKGTLSAPSMESLLDFLEAAKIPEACIIGGGTIFKQYRHLADEIFLTRVHTQIEGGHAFFDLPDETGWKMNWSQEHPKDEKHAFSFRFEQWGRRN